MAVLVSVVIVVLSIMAMAFHSHVKNTAPIDAVVLCLSNFPKLKCAYSRNTLPESGEKLGKGKVLQSEDIVPSSIGNFLYTSTSDGWIKKMHLANGSVENSKCVGGRPLGLAVGMMGSFSSISSPRVYSR